MSSSDMRGRPQERHGVPSKTGKLSMQWEQTGWKIPVADPSDPPQIRHLPGNNKFRPADSPSLIAPPSVLIPNLGYENHELYAPILPPAGYIRNRCNRFLASVGSR